MSFFKKILIAMIALLVPFSAASAAQAAGETVSASTSLSPMGKSFYKQAAVSSNLTLDVVVTPGQGQATVDPLKNVKVTFPAGMTFSPDKKVCTDSQLSLQSPLGNPQEIVDECQSSVIGTGTATILLARLTANPLSDPILVAFNAGKNSSGQPKMKIYGYSQKTSVGILMEGTLKGRVLDIAVPVLSYDSAVADFNLNFPGEKLDRPEIGVVTEGHNKNYVQAKCASSPLVTDAMFELGTRDPSSGQPTGPTTTKVAPQTTQPCTGLAGKAKLKVKKVKGPNAVKNGRKGVFKLVVMNKGTATAKKPIAKVINGGKGKGKGGNIAPGKTKTIKVKVKVKGKKGRKAAVKFLVKSGKVKTKAVKKIRVK